MKFKVIFLDIDGVLNSSVWNYSHQKEIDLGILVDCEKIKMLSQLVHKTNAKIVLHSGWRFWFSDNMLPLRKESEILADMLLDEGIRISEVTPDLTTDEIKRTLKFSKVKADEILAWLRGHDDISGWVVIDDLDLNNEIVRQHQVKTDASEGLTWADILTAEKLLHNEI